MEWIKNNWLLLVIIAAVAAVAWKQFDSSSVYDKLMTDYNAQAEAAKAEREALEASNRKLREETNILYETFHRELSDINKKFDSRLEDVKTEAAQKKKKIVVDAKKDPTTLTDAVTKTFSIPVFPKEEQTNE
jgi:hypothetical protein